MIFLMLFIGVFDIGFELDKKWILDIHRGIIMGWQKYGLLFVIKQSIPILGISRRLIGNQTQIYHPFCKLDI